MLANPLFSFILSQTSHSQPAHLPLTSPAFFIGTLTINPGDRFPVEVTLEDLELPPRREPPRAAASVPHLLGAAPGTPGAAPSSAVVGGAGGAGGRLTEELLSGGDAKGQKAFQERRRDNFGSVKLAVCVWELAAQPTDGLD